jgi:hypothetical protein
MVFRETLLDKMQLKKNYCKTKVFARIFGFLVSNEHSHENLANN